MNRLWLDLGCQPGGLLLARRSLETSPNGGCAKIDKCCDNLKCARFAFIRHLKMILTFSKLLCSSQTFFNRKKCTTFFFFFLLSKS